MSNSTLRQTLRQQRNQLSPRQQQQAAEQLTAHIAQQTVFQRSQRIAFYLASNGEIDPATIMALAEAAGKSCYLPVLHPLKHNRLHFVRHNMGEPLQANCFGILEPKLTTSRIAPAWSLDLILLPLVAFDSQGNRLGMGGGFYDRTLAFTRRTPRTGPQLLGLAHSFQQVADIAQENWDIPLQSIVTEQGVITPKHGTR